MMKNKMKNKKSKIKIAVISALAFSAVSAMAIGATSMKNAVAEEWRGEEIKQNYVYGDTLDVPDYVVNVNGKELTAESVVEFPDGTNYGSDSVRLSQAGKYTVKYMAADGGKIYVKSFDFNVDYTAYTLNSAESSAEYGTYTEFGANSEGLKVRLAKGDTLEFTKLIDVADLTSTNQIIKGFITPDKRGAADFDKLTVTLTDALDSSVYVNIGVWRWTINGNSLGQMCVVAAGQDQVMTGYEPSSGLEVNNGKGTLIYGSWVAQFNSDDGVNLKWGGAACPIAPDKSLISLSFDSPTTKVFAQGCLVSQLNSVDYYKDLWTGFKSNKVRLSISASGYAGGTANFCLTEVLGMDIEGNTFTDTDAPEIVVRTSYTTMPEGMVNRAYRVPEATAYDDYSGNLKADVSVYYNYTSAYPVSVSVINGAFVPDKPGYYAIVYTAKDYSGNVCEREYFMHVGSEIAPIAIELPDVESEVKLGCPVLLKEPKVSGGSGDKTVKITATFGGESLDIADGFIFEKAGEWTITYTATDYVGNTGSATVKINAVASEEPVFNDEAILDPVYISGSEYLLPELYCADYSTGTYDRKLCSVKVEYPDGTTETYESGEKFIPEVQNSGDKVKITYYCGKEEYNNGTQEVAVLVVRNDEEIDCSAYFYGEGFITSYTDDEGREFEKGVLIAAKKAADEMKWTFANAQIAEGFSVEFSTFAKLTKFNAIKITLKDALNPALAATLNISVGSLGTTVSNGDFSIELKDVLTLGMTGVKVGYKNGKFSYGKTNIPIGKYDNGEDFGGFPSRKIYFDFAIENALRGAEYKIDAVSGNVLSSDTGDYSKPTIKINGDYGGNFSINDEYVLYPVTAGDTFSPNVTVKLSVYDSEGKPVTDKNGVILENADAGKEYIIKLDRYGIWTAKYTAQKENWPFGIRKFTAYINVIDRENPVLKIESGYTKTVKAGETIVLPDFSCSDNVTPAENLTITKYVIDSEGRMTILKGDSNSFKTSKAGKYVMCVTVSDEFGNTVTETFVVTVE